MKSPLSLEALKKTAHYAWWIQWLKTTFEREIRYLEFEKQDAKFDWFIPRLKCNKQCASITFRCWKAPSKVRLRYLDVVKQRENLNDTKKGPETILEVAKH